MPGGEEEAEVQVPRRCQPRREGRELCASTCHPRGLQVPWGTAGLSLEQAGPSYRTCLLPALGGRRPGGPEGGVKASCLWEQVQAERDELYQKFTKAINEVQQKTGFKNLLLERKLKGLLSVLEKKEVELSEVFAASNLDPGALSLVSHKLEDVLNSKNATIKDLQLQLARVCKAHNDMLQTFEAKLTAFGIPLDNLGFKPLVSPVLGQAVGQGPAGLVAVPT